ncbi:tubulin alpha chain-like [Chrysoperla carnea]|uniref:tubulin alpha chain-like n=1 Tax=Chrysoperla carnea TaxID=189513 RepID=UPI001D07543D|nr:tubulin alpha chain-like [Chrysoperla carnea]
MDKREILSIHVGQAGLQIGLACWELFCLEHGIKPDGQQGPIRKLFSQNSFPFFEETGAGQYVPRALLIDLEPSVIEEIQMGHTRRLFSKKHALAIGKEDAASNFARGRFTVGHAAMNVIKNNIRKMLEVYENCQAFIIYNSCNGGTGSGLMTLILDYLYSEFCKKTRIAFEINPSEHLSSIMVEPYNALLTTHHTMDCLDCCIMMDNEALYNICQRKLYITNARYQNINRLIAQAVSAITASIRFEGLLKIKLDEFQTNLVPFPRLHFPAISYSPLMTWEKYPYDRNRLDELTLQCFDRRHQFIQHKPWKGKFMACCLLYRGDCTIPDINNTVNRLKVTRNIHFANWCQMGFKVGYNCSPPHCIESGDLAHITKSCCAVSNTTSISSVWKNIQKNFDKMFERRAFLHWYFAEGMEYYNFLDARENMSYLLLDYEEAY